MRKLFLALLAGAILLAVGAYFFWQLFWIGPFDAVVRGGTIFNGVDPPYRTDLGIRNGRIVRIGHLRFARAERVIDARGLAVAPGFIDVHTHVERNLPKSCQPFQAPNFILQGVTTLITGNCGTSVVDVKKMFDHLAQCKSQINVATLMGHNSLREEIMKRTRRKATAVEVRAMEALLTKGMEDGALGFSTGLGYTPGRFADTAEVVSLARLAGERGGLYVTHIRDEAAQGMEAITEAIEVASQAQVPLHISHFKVSGPRQWGSAAQRLAKVQAAKASGLRVTIDQYPYTGSSSTLELLLPDQAVEDRSQLRRLLRDPRARASILAAMETNLVTNGWSDYSFARVAYCKSHPEYDGRTISELARGKRSSSGNPDPGTLAPIRQEAEFVLDLYRRCDPQIVYQDMNESDLLTILRFPDTVFGSDSGVRAVSQARPHPRGWGTFPRVLGRYVREQSVLDLREAIRRMSALPAAWFNLPERGQIRVGYWADLVIVDPENIRDLATYEQPYAQPEGIRYVLVNGAVMVEEGKITHAFPGQALPRGPRSDNIPAPIPPP